MEFGLSEDQKLLQEQVARFLEDAAPLDTVRKIAGEEDAAAANALGDAWAEMGLAGIMVPEAHGGAGLGLLDAALVQEILGRHVTPQGFMASAAVAAAGIMDAASDAQQAAWLPELASGRMRIAVALSEAAATRDGAGVSAGPDGLTGRAVFAMETAAATHILIAGREGDLHLVGTGAPELTVTPMRTIDRTRQVAELILDGVAGEALTGGPDARLGVSRMIATARTLIAADSLGAAQMMLEKAVAYAGERQQFGRVIGSFQAVKHMCAEMAAKLEPCRSLVWYAAHTADAEPDEFPLMAALAKAHMAEVGTFVARTATEVHGGMGFTDLMGLHYWFKRIGLNRQLLGGPEVTRADAARMQGFAA